MNNISAEQLPQLEAQVDMILRHLKQGKSITPIEALNEFGCFRLGARIADLRKEGHNIKTDIKKVGRKRFAEYRLVN